MGQFRLNDVQRECSVLSQRNNQIQDEMVEDAAKGVKLKLPNLNPTSVPGFVQDVCQYLQENHGCHTVVLYGSYARGDHSAESDLDMLGVSSTAISEYRVSHEWELPKIDLDVFVHPESQVPSLKCEDLSKLRGCVPLIDPFGIAAQLKSMVEAWALTPPAALPNWERQQSVSWCKRMLRRASKNDVEGNYRRHWLAMELLPMWFELSGNRFYGPKESLSWLRQHEPQVFDVFEKAMNPSAQLAELECIVSLLEVQI
jgi:uncharacterized protein